MDTRETSLGRLAEEVHAEHIAKLSRRSGRERRQPNTAVIAEAASRQMPTNWSITRDYLGADMSYKIPQRHRPDGNQDELIKLFISLGGLWIPYANKPFDGWAYHARFGYMPVEIKKPERKNHANRYTDRQKKLMDILKIKEAPWLEWEVDDDVYRCIGARRAA